jgi:integrase
MAVLTDKRVKGLKAQQREVEVMDSGNPGFGVRVSPKGRKTFIYRFRLNGKLQRMALGQYPGISLQDGRQAYTRAKERHQSGYHPRGGTVDTVKGLCDLWLERWAKQNRKTWRTDKQRIDAEIIPAWGSRRPDTIRKQDILLLIDTIAERAPVQANRILSLIKQIFKFGVKRDVLESSPAQFLDAPATENARTHTLSKADIKALQTASGSPVKDILLLQLYTGARGGELCSMQWADIEGDIWTCPKTKKHPAVARPLIPAALAIVTKQDSFNEFVFSSDQSKSGHIEQAALLRWCVRNKCEWRPHDIRRAVATGLSGLRIPRIVIQQVLAHLEQSATAIYDRHRYIDEMRDALNQWYGKLQKQLYKTTVKSIDTINASVIV